MHKDNLEKWQHSHRFSEGDRKSESRTKYVVFLTIVMMVVEIVAGMVYGSMALLADGWHMGTHAVALGIALYAYVYARKHANNPSFTFGTGKMNALGGFASSVILAVVALLMIVESVGRLLSPEEIRFNEAILVAVIGLTVNIASAFILQGHHSHDHDDHHHHHDHNLRAAYMHVIADALTSFLAIFALLAGKYFHWIWMDPAMGIVGALVIVKWAHGLLRDTGKVLLDSGVKSETVKTIKEVVENDSDNKIADLHVWQIGSNELAVICSVVTHYPKEPEHYKKLILEKLREVKHISIEVHKGIGDPCSENSPQNSP